MCVCVCESISLKLGFKAKGSSLDATQGSDSRDKVLGIGLLGRVLLCVWGGFVRFNMAFGLSLHIQRSSS